MSDTDEITRLRADNERLRARVVELEGQHKGLVLQNAILRQRPDLPLNRIPAARAMVKLYADNERLRGALKLFACDCAENDLCKFPHACRNYIARAALDGQPAPGEGKPRTDSRYNNAERIFGDD